MIQPGYNIPVVSPRATTEYTYTETDTVAELQKKIFQNEGIPVQNQQLDVRYVWRKGISKCIISDKPDELLKDHLQTAEKVKLIVVIQNIEKQIK